MSSNKIYLWDIEKTIQTVSFGIVAFFHEDSYTTSFANQALRNKFSSVTWKTSHAGDISLAHLQDNLQGADLFGVCDSLLINAAEDLSLEMVEELKRANVDEHYIILNFTNKIKFKAFEKNQNIQKIEVSVPRSWDNKICLQYFLRRHQVKFDVKVERHFLDIIPLDYLEYDTYVNLFSIAYPTQVITEKEWGDLLIDIQKNDFFSCIDLVYKKRHKELFEILLSLQGTSKHRELIALLINHLKKMYDSDSLAGSNNFERTIIEKSRSFKKGEILRLMRDLMELITFNARTYFIRSASHYIEKL